MRRNDFPNPMLDEITPLIITHDEAPNIARTLDKLGSARRIVVIDSGSTDDTVRIARSYCQVEVIAHPFTDFASQCNFGLTQVTSPWVLSLDADYELTDDLVRELQALAPPLGIAGFRARFVYRIFGRALRGTLYPPRTVLYRREAARYRNEGHGHRVVVDGAVLDLRGAIYHDDRKPLARCSVTPASKPSISWRSAAGRAAPTGFA
jgi:glycosyltransferase involved in cell wall biosynthesis